MNEWINSEFSSVVFCWVNLSLKENRTEQKGEEPSRWEGKHEQRPGDKKEGLPFICKDVTWSQVWNQSHRMDKVEQNENGILGGRKVR